MKILYQIVQRTLYTKYITNVTNYFEHWALQHHTSIAAPRLIIELSKSWRLASIHFDFSNTQKSRIKLPLIPTIRCSGAPQIFVCCWVFTLNCKRLTELGLRLLFDTSGVHNYIKVVELFFNSLLSSLTLIPSMCCTIKLYRNNFSTFNYITIYNYGNDFTNHHFYWSAFMMVCKAIVIIVLIANLFIVG